MSNAGEPRLTIGDDERVVWGDHKAVYTTSVGPLEVGRPRSQVPDTGRSVTGAGHGETALPREHDAQDLAAVPLQNVLAASGNQVPDDGQIVTGNRDSRVAVGENGTIADPSSVAF